VIFKPVSTVCHRIWEDFQINVGMVDVKLGGKKNRDVWFGRFGSLAIGEGSEESDVDIFGY
jgi:hypothetical protein